MQSSVDNKNKLIISLRVVNDINNQSQMYSMVSETNNILSKNKDRMVLADTGYYNAQEIKKCLDDGNSLYLTPQKAKCVSGNSLYSKDNFQYQKENGTYLCPEGNKLPYVENTSKNGIKYKRYIGRVACLSCSLFEICTTAKN